MIGIVYNPHTNKGASVERMKKIREELDSRGVQYEYRETTYAGEAIVLAKELAKTCDTLIAAGGDGTFYEVVNGTIDEDVTYAIMPFGSGNDNSRSLGIKSLADSDLIDTALSDNVLDMDCMVYNDETISIQFVAMGIVPEVLSNFVKMEKVSGMNYVKALLGAMRKHKPKTYKVEIDGTEEEYLADMVAMMNIKTAGGGFRICPDADISDRQLDLVVVTRTGRIRYFLNLVALMRGKLLKQPNVVHKRVTCATMIAGGVEEVVIDGEMMHFDKVKVELCPKQIRVKH